LIKPISAL